MWFDTKLKQADFTANVYEGCVNNKFSRLFFVSFLALFLELLLIRYLAVEIRFFMFFKNFVLMAAFLGLGLGIGNARKSSSVFGIYPPLAVLVPIAVFAQELNINLGFLPTADNSFIWYSWLNFDAGKELLAVFTSCLGLTLLVAMVFFPLGQVIGRLLMELPPARSYAWDLCGSIAGVAAYSATAFFGWSPKFCMILALIAAIPLISGRRLKLAAAAITFSLAVVVSCFNAVPSWSPSGQTAADTVPPQYLWSPYHRVHWIPYSQPVTAEAGLVNPGYIGYLNNYYYFDLLDFNLAKLNEPVKLSRHGAEPDMDEALAHYSVPYQFHTSAQSVLLLGAGPGNDAAVALLHGIPQITAVEIDPAVVRLGREVHPMRPYNDPRVKVVVDDARAYMARTADQYDIVSFGHLDSINLVSSFSSVRTDSYIYTKESMRQAYALVKPGGILSVSFSATNWIHGKINALLSAASGSTPYALKDSYMNTTTLIVRKPGGSLNTSAADKAIFDKILNGQEAVKFDPTPEDVVPTDDWPYIFMKERAVSPYHVTALAILLLITFLSAARVYGTKSIGTFRWGPFWLGVGFMLIETKSLTELGLLFGSTWFVTAIGIVGVLAMNLIALGLIGRYSIRQPVLYILLFGAIALNLLIPLEVLLPLSLGWRLFSASILIYLPLLFAGAAFAKTLASSKDPSFVFGSNMIGAMVGGMLEYLSVVFGFRMLWVIGAVIYLFAFLSEPSVPSNLDDKKADCEPEPAQPAAI